MTLPVNKVSQLQLEPGQPVDVRGQLVLRNKKPVITGYRMLSQRPGSSAELRWMHTPYVPLALTEAEAEALVPLLSETVFGSGTWLGRGVRLKRLVADDSWTRTPADDLNYVKDTSPVSDHVRTIEAPLFASGAMLRRVRLLDEFGPRVIACGMDPDAIAQALTPIYGENLEILKSKWSASELRGLDDVLNDLPDDRVLKVQYRMDLDGVISRKIRVNYVDAALVEALGRFPDDILAVEAVLEPPGTPQDRDIFIQPRSRVRPGTST